MSLDAISWHWTHLLDILLFDSDRCQSFFGPHYFHYFQSPMKCQKGKIVKIRRGCQSMDELSKYRWIVKVWMNCQSMDELSKYGGIVKVWRDCQSMEGIIYNLIGNLGHFCNVFKLRFLWWISNYVPSLLPLKRSHIVADSITNFWLVVM